MALTSGLAHSELVDENRFMTQPWQTHFREVNTAIASAPSKETVLQLPPQTGLINFATLPVTLLAPGVYRVSMSVRVTTRATTSSTLGQVDLHWTDGAVPCSQGVIPALTTNTTSTVGSGVIVIRVDYNTAIAYSVGYASVPADEMTYELRIVLEGLGGK